MTIIIIIIRQFFLQCLADCIAKEYDLVSTFLKIKYTNIVTFIGKLCNAFLPLLSTDKLPASLFLDTSKLLHGAESFLSS